MRARTLHTIGWAVAVLTLGVAGSAWAGGFQQVDPTTLPPTGIRLEIPFAYGTEIEVSQSHGTFSHTGHDYWGWDFRAPVGTPVLAAHDGIVRMARSDSRQGGCFREAGSWANYVILSHPSGYETQYLHFSKVFVVPGQHVRAGQVIGEIGTTGFSCGSHLHFQLQQGGGSWAGQSVPATFRGIGDPQAHTVVVSQNFLADAGRRLQAQARR